MISLLYIDLKEKNEVRYEKEIISRLTSTFPELNAFDIDYQSDSVLIDYAKRLLKESKACILYVESDNTHSHKIVPFLEEFLQDQEKFILFLEGENSWLMKLSKGLQNNQVYLNLEKENIIKTASEFISSKS